MISITAHGMASATTESLHGLPGHAGQRKTKNARTAGTTACLDAVLTTIGVEAVGFSPAG
jgi:hypothetical protein